MKTMKYPTCNQRLTVLIALAVMAIMTLVPPWVYTTPNFEKSFTVPAGYRLLVFAPRERQGNGEIDRSLSPRIDVSRLVFQYIAVVLIAAFALVKQRKPSVTKPNESHNGSPSTNQDMEELENLCDFIKRHPGLIALKMRNIANTLKIEGD
jgi:hypothetical protein